MWERRCVEKVLLGKELARGRKIAGGGIAGGGEKDSGAQMGMSECRGKQKRLK